MLRKLLLVCGTLVLPLYALTDLLGGLRHGHYSFSSQAISELGAPGTLSAPFVGPLFGTATVFLLLFGIGMIVASGGNRSRRLAGIVVAAQTIVGFSSAAFPMHQRGSGGNDIPHLVLMGVLTPLLIVLAVTVGRSAIGPRFRRYSLATVAALLVSIALTAAYVPRVAAVQPTPGLGVVERVFVYAYMLWAFVAAIGLLRHAHEDRVSRTTGASGKRLQPVHW